MLGSTWKKHSKGYGQKTILKTAHGKALIWLNDYIKELKRESQLQKCKELGEEVQKWGFSGRNPFSSNAFYIHKI